MERVLDVYYGTAEPASVGRCFVHGFGKTLTSTFTYTDEWLHNPDSFSLMPGSSINNYSYHYNGLPPFLKDVSPDRWGRMLIHRHQRMAAIDSNSTLSGLDDYDYLVGVSDWARAGALRIKSNSSFVCTSSSIPRVINLPKLVAYSFKAEDNVDAKEAIKELLDVGSNSLGGARPKATVQQDDRLLLAKFPSIHDEWDVIRWEYVALIIAKCAGLNTPNIELVELGKQTVLLEERFDRKKHGERIHFASGQTVLNTTDGSNADYADFGLTALTLVQNQRHFAKELLGRVALSVILHNTDDHMKNHGMLYDNQEWMLSPVYDVTLNPYEREERVTSILGTRGENEHEILVPFGVELGLSERESLQVIWSVVDACVKWETIARKAHCKQEEIAMFSTIINQKKKVVAQELELYGPKPSLEKQVEIDESPSIFESLNEITQIPNENPTPEQPNIERDDIDIDCSPHARG